MKIIAFAAALLMACTTATFSASQSKPEPIVIANDGGGQIASYVARRKQLAASGRPIEIRGTCFSSCTILITLPNACLGPKAVIGFHQASAGNGTAMPILNPLIGHFYRNGILDMWNREWSRSTKLSKINASQYVKLDPETRICG